MFLNLSEIQNIILTQDSTIYDAIKNLSDSGLRIVLIKKKKNHFIGVINDGDIRRAFLKGFSLNSPINSIINKKPTTLQSFELKSKLNSSYGNFSEPIPVLKKNKIFGVLTLRKMKIRSTKVTDKLDIDVIIMAGGFGSRLYPLTKKTPKPLLKYKNKTLIEHIIESISMYGINRFYISIYYKKNLLKKFFIEKKFKNKKILFLEEKKPMGTIGSLSMLEKITNNFIVLNCDVISNTDFNELYKSHVKSSCLMTVCVKKIRLQNPYGTIVSKGKKLIEIKEKPNFNLDINAGIYVFSNKIIKIISANSLKSVDELINYLILKKININVFHIVEKWQDFGQDLKTLKKYN